MPDGEELAMPSYCCGTSVGGRVRRTTPNGDEFAVLSRGWWPIGHAYLAGHGKDKNQETFHTAVIEEANEELGLDVVEATKVLTIDLPNLCSATPANPPGHRWTVFDLRVTPDAQLHPSPAETRGAAWVNRDHLQRLADATVRFAHSRRPAAEQPGDSLEAVWVELCHRLGDIAVSDADRSAVRRLYTTPPPTYWRGGRPGAR